MNEVERLRDCIALMVRMAGRRSSHAQIALVGQLALGTAKIRKISKTQQQIITHALGLDVSLTPHRSHYIAPMLSEMHGHIESLVDAGLMRCSDPVAGIYHVTEAGALAVGHLLP